MLAMNTFDNENSSNELRNIVISIIIPLDDPKSLSETCLIGLSKQNFPFANFELVLAVENNIYNATVQINSSQYPFKINVVSPDFVEETGEWTSAFTNAIMEAEGKYVLFITPDSMPEQNLLELHYKAILDSENPQVCIVGNYKLMPELAQTPLRFIAQNSNILFPYPSMENEKVYNYNYFNLNNTSIAKQALVNIGILSKRKNLKAYEYFAVGYLLERAGCKFIFQKNIILWNTFKYELDSFLSEVEKRGYNSTAFFAVFPDLNPFKEKSIWDYEKIIKKQADNKKGYSDVYEKLNNDEYLNAFEYNNEKLVKRSQEIFPLLNAAKEYMFINGQLSNEKARQLFLKGNVDAEDKALVSVFIENNSDENNLKQSIQSIINQSYRNIEAIILNRNSTFDTRKVIDDLLNSSELNLRVINDDGLSRSRKLDFAQGKFVVNLVSGEYFEVDALKYCVELFNDKPNLGFVYFDKKDYKNDIYKTEIIVESPEFSFNELRKNNYIPNSAVVLKSILNEIGLDDILGSSNRWDLWLSLSERGYFGDRIPKALINCDTTLTTINREAFSIDNFILKYKIIAKHNFLYTKNEILRAKFILNLSCSFPKNEIQAQNMIKNAVDELDFLKAETLSDFSSKLFSDNSKIVLMHSRILRYAGYIPDAVQCLEKFTNDNLSAEILHEYADLSRLNAESDLVNILEEKIKSAYPDFIPEDNSPYLKLGDKYINSLLVNIGMVTYNRLDFTKQSIESIIKNTGGNYVLTVVDNNSSDGTREYLKDLKSKGIIKNLILLDDNIGIAPASNIAWSAEPDADFYLKIDNDIVINKKNWLKPLIEASLAIPQAGTLGYNFEPISYPLQTVNGKAVRIKSPGHLGGACVFIPQNTEKTIGYWCEDYGLYGEEDTDYGWRSHLAGLLNVYMEDEDVGVHLPGGKAAVIDYITKAADDESELKIHKEYRLMKDRLRQELQKKGGLLMRNVNAYSSNMRNLYIPNGGRYLGLFGDDLEVFEKNDRIKFVPNSPKLKESDRIAVKTRFERDKINLTRFYKTLLMDSEPGREILAAVRNIYAKAGGNQIELGFDNNLNNLNSELKTESDKNTIIQKLNNNTGNKKKPDFSIIIPVLNNLKFTQNCIESIKANSNDVNYEIIIIDNGSTDGTKEFLSSIQSESVKFIVNNTPQTYSCANNQGAKLAIGEYLLFLNNDTKALPNWLAELKYEFENYPKTGIQGAKLIYEDGSVQHCGIVFGVKKVKGTIPYHIYLGVEPNFAPANKRRKYQFVTGACMAVRRNLFVSVGGFDEEYYFGWEDTDLCMKVGNAGYDVIYNPKVVLFHFESATKQLKIQLGLDSSSENSEREMKNKSRFMSKWGDFVKLDADEVYKSDGLRYIGNTLLSIKEAENMADENGNIPEFLTSFSKRYWERNYQKANKVLIKFSSAIGDAITVTGICHELKRMFPNIKIYVSSADYLSDIYLYNKDISEYIIAGSEREKELEAESDEIINYRNIISNLPEYYNSIAYSDIFGNLAGIKFDNYSVQYTITKQEHEYAVSLIKDFKSNARLIGLQMQTQKDEKRSYPHFEQLISVMKTSLPETKFVHFGNERVDFIDSSLFDCAGKEINLRNQIAIAELCDEFLTIDSAFLHIAHSLLKKPTTVICGLTNPYLIGNPNEDLYFIRNNKVDCLDCYWQRNCYIDCMRTFSPEQVVEKFIEKSNLITKSSKKLKTVKIKFVTGDDFSAMLYNFFLKYSGAVNIQLIDEEGVLPEYAVNWNGMKLETNSNDNINDKNINDKIKMSSDNLDINIPEECMNNSATNREKITEKQYLPKALDKAMGVLPSNLPNPLYLNLGCGSDIRDNWTNIDLYGSDERVVFMDVRHLEMPDNSADIILANNIIEYFSHWEIDSILTEWHRVLKPGAELIIKTPSLKLQLKSYMNGTWDADVASFMIFGSQKNLNDYHAVAFDETSIKTRLIKAGFEVTEFEESYQSQDKGFVNQNLNVKAKKNIIENINYSLFDTYSHENAENSNILPFKEEKDDSEIPEIQENIREAVKDEVASDNISSFDNVVNKLENEISDTIPQKQNYYTLDTQVDIGKALSEFPEKIDRDYSKMPYLNIVWEGSQFICHSLALVNREQCINILKTGLAELTIVPYEPDQYFDVEDIKQRMLAEHDIRFKTTDIPKQVKDLPYLWVRHQWPPKAEAPLGAKWIIMQPWEFTTLRKNHLSIFKKAVEIWTPSNYSRKCFINSGLDFDKVQVIPNGIDPKLFTPDGPKLPIPTMKRFKMLFVGGTIYRKGIDLLLKVFTSLYKRDDDICLVIKDMGGDSFYQGRTAKDLIESIRKKPDSPEIIYIDNYLSDDEMANLYRACDLFVSPYRGEGFSLPALEAMACGLPVVVTEGGSTDDFVDEDCGWFIPAEKRSIGSDIDGFELTGEAFVLEPDIHELAAILKHITADPSQVAIKGLAAAYKARTDWTWNKSTLKMLSRIDCLSGTKMAAEALDVLKDEDDNMIMMGYADKLFKDGKYEKAEKVLNQALCITEMPEKYRIHNLHLLAWIAILQKDYNKAVQYLDSAIIDVIENVDNKYLRAKIDAGSGKWVEALEKLKDLMDNWIYTKYETTIGVALDDLICDTGDGLYAMDDAENALLLYTEALKYNNNNYNACFGSAKCFINSGAVEDGKKMLEWALKLNPNFKDAVIELEKIKKM